MVKFVCACVCCVWMFVYVSVCVYMRVGMCACMHACVLYRHTIITVCSVYIFLVETGGITIAPRPAADDSPPKPGFPSTPFFGILPVLMTENVRYIQALVMLSLHFSMENQCSIYVPRNLRIYVILRLHIGILKMCGILEIV